MQMKSSIAGGKAQYVPASPGRIHLYGIDERSSGVDPVLANLFKTMRASLSMSTADLARLLRMPPDVLTNLEAGRIRALPPFPETVRFITDYGRLLDIDVKPILSRIKEQTGEKSAPLVAKVPAGGRLGSAIKSIKAPAWMQRQPVTGDAGTKRIRSSAMPPALAGNGTVAAPGNVAKTEVSGIGAVRRSRALRRVGMTVTISATLLAGIWSAAQSQSPVLFAAVDQLPSGIANSIRQSIDRIAVRMVRKDDGLTWVVVGDPRSRKSDRLPVGKAGG